MWAGSFPHAAPKVLQQGPFQRMRSRVRDGDGVERVASAWRADGG